MRQAASYHHHRITTQFGRKFVFSKNWDKKNFDRWKKTEKVSEKKKKKKKKKLFFQETKKTKKKKGGGGGGVDNESGSSSSSSSKNATMDKPVRRRDSKESRDDLLSVLQGRARDPYAKSNIPVEEVLREVSRRLRYYRGVRRRVAQSRRRFDSERRAAEQERNDREQQDFDRMSSYKDADNDAFGDNNDGNDHGHGHDGAISIGSSSSHKSLHAAMDDDDDRLMLEEAVKSSGSFDSMVREQRKKRNGGRSDRPSSSSSGAHKSILGSSPTGSTAERLAIWQFLHGGSSSAGSSTASSSSSNVCGPLVFLPRRIWSSSILSRANAAFMDDAGRLIASQRQERRRRRAAAAAASAAGASPPSDSNDNDVDDDYALVGVQRTPSGQSFDSSASGVIYLLRDAQSKFPKLASRSAPSACRCFDDHFAESLGSLSLSPSPPRAIDAGMSSSEAAAGADLVDGAAGAAAAAGYAVGGIVVRIASVHTGRSHEVIHRIKVSNLACAERFLYFVLDEWRFRPQHFFLCAQVVRWLCTISRLTPSSIQALWKSMLDARDQHRHVD
jgi:hypothetical protein